MKVVGNIYVYSAVFVPIVARMSEHIDRIILQDLVKILDTRILDITRRSRDKMSEGGLF